MKKTKRILCLCLVIIMLLSLILSITSTAFAAEVSGNGNVCNLTISVIDQSAGYPGENFKVIFKSSDKEEILEVTKAESWGADKVITFPLTAPAEYAVTFDGLADGYVVMDTITKTAAASTLDATAGEAKFLGWAIVDNEQLRAQEKKPKEEKENNVEAEKVYQEFLDVVSFMETDDSWYDGYNATLNQYGQESVNRNTYSKWYTEYVYGGNAEKYFSMSSFEQFLWTETYTRLANAKNSGWGYDYFFGNKESFASNITDVVCNTLNGNNAEEVKAAYLKLMDWQFDYITKNGEPFNFIRNRSYTEEMKTAYAEEKEEAKPVPEETEPVVEAEEEGLWGETMEILAKNALSIILLIILGGAIFVLYYIRKVKNIDGESH